MVEVRLVVVIPEAETRPRVDKPVTFRVPAKEPAVTTCKLVVEAEPKVAVSE